MKTFRFFATLFSIALLACSTGESPSQEQSEQVATPPDSIVVNLDVDGSSCDPASVDVRDNAPILDSGVVDAAAPVIVDAGPRLKPRAFFYGNSLVYGSGLQASQLQTSTVGAQLRDLLGNQWEASEWIGRGGWPTSMLITAAPHDLAKYLPENRSAKVLVFWEAVNEMGSPFNCEAYEIMARKRLAEGWKVILVTATVTNVTADIGPDGGVNTVNAYWTNLRHKFNACVKANYASWGVSSIVDIDSHPELLNPYNTTYYLDKVHLTPLGYHIVALDALPKVKALYVAP